MSGIMVEVASEGSSYERAECDRERGTTEIRSSPQPRDAPETEMEIMRRELELLRARLSAINSTRYTHDAPRAHVSTETGWIQNKVSLNVIAELLPEFDGTSHMAQ